MKNTTIAALLFVSTFNVMAAVPDGKIEKPFSFNNEVVCLKEIESPRII